MFYLKFSKIYSLKIKKFIQFDLLIISILQALQFCNYP